MADADAHSAHLIDSIADELKPYKPELTNVAALLRQRCESMYRIYREVTKKAADMLRRESGTGVHDNLLDVAQRARSLARALGAAPSELGGESILFANETKRKQLPTEKQLLTKKQLLEEHQRMAVEAEEAAARVPIPNSRGSPDKFVCAVLASILMGEFSQKRPTTTPGVGFLEISSLLYELFTGIRDKRFDSACRRLLRPD
jgi:hypothetical protein